jgi:hypothetical protein
VSKLQKSSGCIPIAAKDFDELSKSPFPERSIFRIIKSEAHDRKEIEVGNHCMFPVSDTEDDFCVV